MKQDDFNKLYTTILTIFFMAIYTAGFILNKQVPWEGILTFLVPTVNHITHILTQNRVTVENIRAETTTTTAPNLDAVKGAVKEVIKEVANGHGIQPGE